MREINWTKAGEPDVPEDGRASFLALCESIEWRAVPCDLPAMPGEACRAMRDELRLPRVTHVAYRPDPAPYGIVACRAHWTNGSGEVYALDKGGSVVVVVSMLERSEEHPAIRQARALGLPEPDPSAYARRIEEKRERLEDAAEKRETSAARVLNVGPDHYSRDWAFVSQPGRIVARDRWNRSVDRAIRESSEASELRSRAASLGRAGVSSDDPDGPEKLRARLAEMEAKRDEMKRRNAQYRKVGAEGMTDADGTPWTDAAKARLAKAIAAAYSWEKAPHAKWEIANLGANIRRVADRIEVLERAASEPEREPIRGDGWTIYDDRDANRIGIRFPARQPDEVCARVKSMGFHWNRGAVAWTRLRGGAAWYQAQVAVKHTDERGVARVPWGEPQREPVTT